MKVTIWSDFNCPFCYIGQAHLEKALKETGTLEDVEIEYNSYQLSPDAEYREGENYIDHLASMKGSGTEEIRQMLSYTEEMANNVGLEINHETIKHANTFDAHRVFQFAKSEGLGQEYFKRFYKAHFVEGKILSDHETITKLATEVGLNEAKVSTILENPTINQDAVKQEILVAQTIGVQGVPFYVFNNKYGLSGAQPIETFKQVLETVQNEA
ncbi:DsbA family oxidoreductase [Aerococcaceae bacterium DSM 111176]|nr:DsbA family oxidoreductase [Aerococcaceae bacterium DSM 111176]